MVFIIDLYFIVNNFLIKYIPEIVFSLVALIIILAEPYLIYLEKLISNIFKITTRRGEGILELMRIDSFVVFLLLIIIILPLVKRYLMGYLEKVLNSENLLFYLIVLFIGLYVYYILVYRRKHSKN